MGFDSGCGCGSKKFDRCDNVNATRYIVVPEKEHCRPACEDKCERKRCECRCEVKRCCKTVRCCKCECCGRSKNNCCCRNNRNNLWWLVAALIIL